MLFTSKKPHYQHLRQKWQAKEKSLHESLLDKHTELRQLAAGGLSGLMLLTTPVMGSLPDPKLLAEGNTTQMSEQEKNALLAQKLKSQLPSEMRALTTIEEDQISQILSENYGFKVAASIDGKKLNRTYGVIGGEQHLYRYPGDALSAHADNTQDWAMYGGAGIAPGLGAWGYFASSKAEFTDKDKERERFYLAVQTFLAPGFAENVKEYRDFFKFRKMLVVNPKTGQSVVADIGDAGPAEWTGKHLGGSPEVMHFLGLAQGPRKGAVLYFFLDDPEDKIPLGPIRNSVSKLVES